MKKEKVIYRGPKGRIAITVPIGVKSKGQIKEIIFFTKGEEKELNAEDARILCSSDMNFKLAAATAKIDPVEKKIPTRAVKKTTKVSKLSEVEFVSSDGTTMSFPSANNLKV